MKIKVGQGEEQARPLLTTMEESSSPVVVASSTEESKPLPPKLKYLTAAAIFYGNIALVSHLHIVHFFSESSRELTWKDILTGVRLEYVWTCCNNLSAQI